MSKIPKRIIYYSIGSHGTKLVQLYLQKLLYNTNVSISTSLNSSCSSVKALVSSSLSCFGPIPITTDVFGGLSHPNWNMKHYNHWNFCQVLEYQAPCTNAKPYDDFLAMFQCLDRSWNIYQSIQIYTKQFHCLVLAQNWKPSLWPGCGK